MKNEHFSRGPQKEIRVNQLFGGRGHVINEFLVLGGFFGSFFDSFWPFGIFL